MNGETSQGASVSARVNAHTTVAASEAEAKRLIEIAQVAGPDLSRLAPLNSPEFPNYPARCPFGLEKLSDTTSFRRPNTRSSMISARIRLQLLTTCTRSGVNARHTRSFTRKMLHQDDVQSEQWARVLARAGAVATEALEWLADFPDANRVNKGRGKPQVTQTPRSRSSPFVLYPLCNRM